MAEPHSLTEAIGRLASMPAQERGDNLLGLDGSGVSGGQVGVRGAASRLALQNRLSERAGSISLDFQSNMRRRLGRHGGRTTPDPLSTSSGREDMDSSATWACLPGC